MFKDSSAAKGVTKIVTMLSYLAVLLCMISIYLLSAQPASESNRVSKGIVEQGVETGIKITKAQITEQEKRRLIDDINSTGREYMHGVVFLLLGLLVLNAVRLSGVKGIKALTISLAACAAYGLADEVHQVFVPGRAFQLSDFFMDMLGGTIGIFCMELIYQKATKRTAKRIK